METTEQRIEKLKKENPLSPAIAGHYTLNGLIPGIVSVGGVEYDLRKIDLETAHKLVKGGFANLVPKKAEDKK